jgi:hypothetical protein
MFINTLAGLSLLIHVSIGPGALAPDADDSYVRMSLREKSAILDPLIHTATDCVAQAVLRDPRLGKAQVTDLIVDSFKNCTAPVREMIDAHDRYFGPGSGEQFFMGPYLDTLPANVVEIVGKTR